MTDSTRGKRSVDVPEGRLIIAPLFGPQDAFKRLLERRLQIKLSARGGQLLFSGPPMHLDFAERVLVTLVGRIRDGATLLLHDLDHLISLMEEGVEISAARQADLRIESASQVVVPKSPNQAAYLESMRDNDLVFATGPAGTGKTYLAMAAAVAALRRQEVERIILARPAVEAGERLGFLPGSLVDKVNPYLRPLHDALFDLMGVEQASRMMDSGIIEVAPLAFMRGRTLNRAFVILDEAQNTTREQMKMFLTRLGYSSRAVVTGDVTQVDLDQGQPSGLVHALKILTRVDRIGFVKLTPVDVVRHPLVRAIVRAYDRAEASKK